MQKTSAVALNKRLARLLRAKGLVICCWSKLLYCCEMALLQIASTFCCINNHLFSSIANEPNSLPRRGGGGFGPFVVFILKKKKRGGGS